MAFQSRGPNKFAPNHKTLFVSNLAEITTYDRLQEYFQQFGEVKKVILHYNLKGMSRKFAFVTFETIDACSQALMAHHPTIDKSFITVKIVRNHGPFLSFTFDWLAPARCGAHNTINVKKARAQSAKPKERAHVDGEAAVGSEFPVFAWWTVDPKTMEAGSDILLTSIELTRLSETLWGNAGLARAAALPRNRNNDFSCGLLYFCSAEEAGAALESKVVRTQLKNKIHSGDLTFTLNLEPVEQGMIKYRSQNFNGNQQQLLESAQSSKVRVPKSQQTSREASSRTRASLPQSHGAAHGEPVAEDLYPQYDFPSQFYSPACPLNFPQNNFFGQEWGPYTRPMAQWASSPWYNFSMWPQLQDCHLAGASQSCRRNLLIVNQVPFPQLFPYCQWRFPCQIPTLQCHQMPFVFLNGAASNMQGNPNQVVCNQMGFAVNSHGAPPQSSRETQDEKVTTNTCGSLSTLYSSPLRAPSTEQNFECSKPAWQREPSDHAPEADGEVDCYGNVADAMCDESGHYGAPSSTSSRKSRRRGLRSGRKSFHARSTADSILPDENEGANNEVVTKSNNAICSSPIAMVAESMCKCNIELCGEHHVPRPMCLHPEKVANTLDNVELALTKNSLEEECQCDDSKIQLMEHVLVVEANQHDHKVYEQDGCILADDSRSSQTTPVKIHIGTHQRRKSSRGSRNAQKLMSFQDPGVNGTDSHVNQHENAKIAA